MRYRRSELDLNKYRSGQRGWFSLIRRKRRVAKSLFSSDPGIRLDSRYRNPLYPLPGRFDKKSLLIAAFFSFVFAWLLALVYLPFFRVRHFAIAGENIIPEAEIAMAVSSSIAGNFLYPRNNYFFVRPKRLADFLRQKFFLSSAEVKKIFPDGISVSIEEPQIAAIYDDSKSYYLLAENGLLFKKIGDVLVDQFVTTTEPAVFRSSSIGAAVESATTGTITFGTISLGTIVRRHMPGFDQFRASHPNLAVIYDPSAAPVGEGAFLASSTVAALPAIKSVLTSLNKMNWDIKYFTIESSGFSVASAESWLLYFAESDIAGQIQKLNIFLSSAKPSVYVDLRFEDRVFWK